MKIALALIIAATQALKLESNFKAPESGELDLQETVNALNFVGDETVELYDDTDLESEISTISTVSNFKSGGKTTAPAKKLSELY